MLTLYQKDRGVSVIDPIRTFTATSEPGTTVSFSITGGATQAAFFMPPGTGDLLQVDALDFETTNAHVLTITATDGTLSTDLTYTLTVTDVTQTASPVVTGMPVEGQTLTATFTPAGDTTIGTISYEWQTNASGSFDEIPGETGTTYTTDADDVGNTIQVVVSYMDGRDGSDVVQTVTQTSNTLAIRAASAPNTTGTNSGNLRRLLCGKCRCWSNSSNHFRWQYRLYGSSSLRRRNRYFNLQLKHLNRICTQHQQPNCPWLAGQSLDFETTQSYTLTLTVTEAGTNLTDTATVTVTVTDVTQTASPTVTGTASEGNTFTAALSAAGDTSLDPITYQWQWAARGTTDFSDISGETNSTFSITATYRNREIRVVVQYPDGRDNGGTVTLVTRNSPARLVARGTNVSPSFSTVVIDEARTLSHPENSTAAIYTIVATDANNDNLSYFISPGGFFSGANNRDRDHFSINGNTGELSFNAPQDFENPSGSEESGLRYVVEVQVSDGNNSIGISVRVTLTNVVESLAVGCKPGCRYGSRKPCTVYYTHPYLRSHR